MLSLLRLIELHLCSLSSDPTQQQISQSSRTLAVCASRTFFASSTARLRRERHFRQRAAAFLRLLTQVTAIVPRVVSNDKDELRAHVKISSSCGGDSSWLGLTNVATSANSSKKDASDEIVSSRP